MKKSAVVPVIPVLYDETHRGKQNLEKTVCSMASFPNLTGFLEHHATDTDGSFTICLAEGTATLVSQVGKEWLPLALKIFSADVSHLKKLYEFVPEQHCPLLNTRDAGKDVVFSLADKTENKALGSIIMTIIFIDANTEEIFCIKLYALVWPGDDLSMGMFIGHSSLAFSDLTTIWSKGIITYEMKFGSGKKARVVHRL